MKVFSFGAFCVLVAGALVASCDLQPKISAIPDGVGDFISTRYPTLLADPETEPEIYNSAVTDYGVYESTDLYGSGTVADYVNYASADDYVLKETVPTSETVNMDKKDNDTDVIEQGKTDEKETEIDEIAAEPDDILSVNDYVTPEREDTPIKNDALVVPEKKIVKPKTVVVQRGDTLYAIARRNGTTVDVLADANGLKQPYALRVGQELSLEKNVTDTKKVEQVKEQKKSVETKVEQPVKTEIKKPETKTAPVTPKTKVITVERGETLYSLSRAYSVPVNDLAVMNNLRPPFDLRVGQSLTVPNVKRVAVPAPQKPEVKTQPEPKVSENPATENKTEKKAEAQTEKKTDAKVASAKTATPVKTPVTNAPVATPKKETVKTQPKQTTKQPATDTKKKNKTDNKKQQPEKKAVTEKPKQTKTETPKIAARSSSKFTWPVRGKILSHYGAKTGGLFNDGINISASQGTTVVAAENGVVAYAGNEVKGMGNLIIIQHEGGWMTVYAHLNSVSVRRGARVTVGQKIGTVGQTGKVSQPQLHFEIRKGRKAYNPINYLKK